MVEPASANDVIGIFFCIMAGRQLKIQSFFLNKNDKTDSASGFETASQQPSTSTDENDKTDSASGFETASQQPTISTDENDITDSASGFDSASQQQPTTSTDESPLSPSNDHAKSAAKEACTKPKPKRKKTFQESWFKEFSWLVKKGDKMYYSLCLKTNSKTLKHTNVFVSGCDNYQHSTLVRHMENKDHLKAKVSHTHSCYMAAATKCVMQKSLPVLEAQIRTAMFLAEHNISNNKYLDMIDLQLANGASVFTERKGILTNHQAPATFQQYISKVLMDSVIVRMKNSPFIGIMLDESLDIATNKKLVLFCKIIHEGRIKIEFCSNVTVSDGKAETVFNSIMNFLQETGIDVRKVSGLGTDGASVMLGNKSGVGVRMKSVNNRIVHIWCAAHRLALVSYWASKKIQYMKTVNEVLVSIYNFYQYSAPRSQKIRQLQKLMGQKVKRFRKPTQVRWLSLSEAVKAVHDSYSSLILSLEHEKASSPNSEGARKATFILKNIKSFKFVSTLSFLRDVLEELDRVSKLFQSDCLDISVLKSSIAALRRTLSSYELDDPAHVADAINFIEEEGMFQGIPLSVNLLQRRQFVRMKQAFINNILHELDVRFPDTELKILNDLNKLFNPKLLPTSQHEINTYGVDCLEKCIDVFGKEPSPLVNAEELRHSHRQLKYLINENRTLNLTDFCLILINDYSEAFPNFATLAAILCTCPLTSVPCERGFSLQNRHHSAGTCRRSVASVQDRMTIEYYCKSMSERDKSKVVNKSAENFYADKY